MRLKGTLIESMLSVFLKTSYGLERPDTRFSAQHVSVCNYKHFSIELKRFVDNVPASGQTSLANEKDVMQAHNCVCARHSKRSIIIVIDHIYIVLLTVIQD